MIHNNSHKLAPWITATASLPGREHTRRRINNQDAALIRTRGTSVTLAVADGCSSGAHSELGARLAVTWLCENAHLHTTAGPEALAGALETYLRDMSIPLDGGSNAARLVHEHFLFTFLVAVWTPDRLWVVGIGDGFLVIDDTLQVIPAGVGNAPPYLGYRLLPELAAAPDLTPRLHHDGPGDAVHTVVLGTDGATDLLDGLLYGSDPIWRAPGLRANPSLLQKSLAARYQPPSGPPDDTTLAVLVRPQRGAP